MITLFSASMIAEIRKQALETTVNRPVMILEKLRALSREVSDYTKYCMFCKGKFQINHSRVGEGSRCAREGYLPSAISTIALMAQAERRPQFALNFEPRRLRTLGLNSLADKVEHVSKTKGDGMGIANEVPSQDFVGMPRLTVRMAAGIQGFPDSWLFSGKKTAAYRKIGNAFPPPVACAVGMQILAALNSAAKPKLMRA